MNALLLAALLVSQCGPNGCPAPSTPYTGWHEGKYYKDGTVAPAPEASDDTTWRTKGVDSSKILEAPKNSINGKEVSQAQAYLKVQGLTDRSAELRTTVVLKDKAKVTEVEKSLADLGKTTRLKVYATGDPMIPGFPDKDAVIIQEPHGKVLHMGPYEGDEKVMEAVRRANEKFDPSKAPDLLNPTALPTGWLLGGGALLLLLIASGKKDQK